MLVRVSGSWELMEPTGSIANFSWNHLSGLANLSLTPWSPPPIPSHLSLSPLFIPPSLTAPICPHSVKVPGGDRRNRRVFCAQLTQSAQSIYNLPFKRWGFFDPTPWTRNQFTATLFVLIFTMHQSCNLQSHNIQHSNTLVYLWRWAIKVAKKKKAWHIFCYILWFDCTWTLYTFSPGIQ